MPDPYTRRLHLARTTGIHDTTAKDHACLCAALLACDPSQQSAFCHNFLRWSESGHRASGLGPAICCTVRFYGRYLWFGNRESILALARGLAPACAVPHRVAT